MTNVELNAPTIATAAPAYMSTESDKNRTDNSVTCLRKVSILLN